ncbi:hypothetical protein ElyMa_000035800 [Elysia marginata]|uniref:Uncharacterized protein n=1 Tax=Elysia marginata TaxID=1093978 RepID=A0AAV4ED58_9GAST|nr:hypothetical protein ElyMa_000035800 [Elysia marginata]
MPSIATLPNRFVDEDVKQIIFTGKKDSTLEIAKIDKMTLITEKKKSGIPLQRTALPRNESVFAQSYGFWWLPLELQNRGSFPGCENFEG